MSTSPPLAIALLLAASPSAFALKFGVLDNDGFGQRILFIHDCEAITNNKDCNEDKNHFAAGDDNTLRSVWRSGPFAEVWLLSGGGNLDAGIGIANELRRNGATVRVPGRTRLARAGLEMEAERDYNCVSSCTVAFMGGQFRFIDPDATYEVHSASAVSWGGLDKDLLEYVGSVLKTARDKGLRYVANDRTDGTRQYARKLFSIFQDTLTLPIRDARLDSELRQRDAILNQWARDGLTRGYSYDAAQLDRDTKLLRFEGAAALQDIMMRIERDSMDQSIADLRNMLPQLGRRADAALAMLAAMYDTSSIKETNVVPRETLVKMGYVTEFVK